MFDMPKFNGPQMGDVKDLPASSQEVLSILTGALALLIPEIASLNKQYGSDMAAAVNSLLVSKTAELAVAVTGGDARRVEATLALHRIAMSLHADLYMRRTEAHLPAAMLAKRDAQVAALPQSSIDDAFDRASEALRIGFANLRAGRAPFSPPAS